GEELLVLAVPGAARRHRADVGHADELLQLGQLGADGLEERLELDVAKDYARPGVVHRVADLLGGQTHVHRLQHGAEDGDGEEAFEEPRRVPVHDRDGVAGLHAEARERAPQPRDALSERRIVVARHVSIRDVVPRRLPRRNEEEILDEKRVIGNAHGTLRLTNGLQAAGREYLLQPGGTTCRRPVPRRCRAISTTSAAPSTTRIGRSSPPCARSPRRTSRRSSTNTGPARPSRSRSSRGWESSASAASDTRATGAPAAATWSPVSSPWSWRPPTARSRPSTACTADWRLAPSTSAAPETQTPR